MNNIENFLNDYKQISKNSSDEKWEIFWSNSEDLMRKTKDYFRNSFQFLSEKQMIDFHDSCLIGNVRPNMDSDTFNITIRALCYEKKQFQLTKYIFEEVEPQYIEFTLDNKFRSKFHKLAVKSDTIMSLVYDNSNLGIVYITDDGNIKTLYLENIDLSQNKSVTKKVSKKMGF